MNAPRRTINQVFDEFLLARRGRQAESAMRPSEELLDDFRSCMDGYGHQWLSDEEARLFDREYSRDEEAGSFCNLFGPEKILENVDDFLGWYLIRKTMASKSTLEAAPAVMRELVQWLVDEGRVTSDAADGSVELLEKAGSLAGAAELASLLYDLSESSPVDALVENQDWENEMAVVSRVEGDTIWLQNEATGYQVPLRVPAHVAEVAEPGWRISALNLGRSSEGWHLLEIGNVYPM